MITNRVLIVGICFFGIYNLKVDCVSSQNEPTKDTGSEEPRDKEESVLSEVFKPTHEWQHIKEGKFVMFAA
jgi:hypothetical protein